jgi:hypothetical protein
MESIIYIETSLPPEMTIPQYRRARCSTRRSWGFLRRLKLS